MENEQKAAESQASKPKAYNPFLTPVSEKAYSQMSVDADPNKFANPIPQPESVTNRVNSNEDAYKMLGDMSMGGSGGNAGGGNTSQNQGSTAFNPAMNNIPTAEKKMGAEQLVKLLVDGYEQLNLFANRGLQISTKKLRKLEADGEIDLSVQIPYDYGKTLSAGEFVETINEQNKDTFSVSKEFKREITPPLVRILEKRGAGLTDEQYVGYLVAKDIIIKGFIAFQVRNTLNEAIEIIKQYTQALRENGSVTPPSGQGSESKASQSSSAQYYPTEEVPSTPIPTMPINEDRFNFETNDTYAESMVQKHEIPEDGKAALLARRKLDRQIEAAVNKHTPQSNAFQQKKSDKKGRAGRKPKDYIPKMDESEIAEALILRETKEPETDKIKGLD
jgi:hypothetical protein